jgi:hypothetical protein
VEAEVNQDQQSWYKTEEVTCGTKVSILCTHRVTHHSKITVHIMTTCHISNSLCRNTCQICLIKITVCWPDILAHFPICILTLGTTSLQYGILGHNNMWHSQWFNFVWTWCHKPKTHGSQLTHFCDCKYLDTEVQTPSAALTIRWLHEGVSLHRTLPVSAWQQMLPFFQLTVLITAQYKIPLRYVLHTLST